MRQLPRKRNLRQAEIIELVKEYFGEENQKSTIAKIALWLMGKRKGVILSDEEKEDLRLIRANLEV